MSINEQNVRTFVEALRGDDFTQGIGRLQTIDGENCCLGVASHLSGTGEFVSYGEAIARTQGQAAADSMKARGDVMERPVFFVTRDEQGTEDGYDQFGLTPEVAKWLGVHPDDNASLFLRTKDGRDTSAAELNDDGADFNAIADEIERNLLNPEFDYEAYELFCIYGDDPHHRFGHEYQ